MADYKWIIETGYPQGHLVELTAEEQAQLDADRAAAAAATTAAAAEETNAATIRQRLTDALANLDVAYTNWATLTAAQKDAALRLDVRTTAGLVRLYLRQLATAGNGT